MKVSEIEKLFKPAKTWIQIALVEVKNKDNTSNEKFNFFFEFLIETSVTRMS